MFILKKSLCFIVLQGGHDDFFFAKLMAITPKLSTCKLLVTTSFKSQNGFENYTIFLIFKHEIRRDRAYTCLSFWSGSRLDIWDFSGYLGVI